MPRLRRSTCWPKAMKIGKLELGIVGRKTEEVESGLLRLTGLSVKEMREALAHPCLASTVAAALLPFLDAPMERITLARAIAADDLHKVQLRVRKLYDALLDPRPKGARRAAKEG